MSMAVPTGERSAEKALTLYTARGGGHTAEVMAEAIREPFPGAEL